MDEDLIFDYPYIKSITREIRVDYLTKIAKISVELAMQKFGFDDIRELSIENTKVLLPVDMHTYNTIEELVEIIDTIIKRNVMLAWKPKGKYIKDRNTDHARHFLKNR